MAKVKTAIRMNSTASGYFKVARKNPKKVEKLTLRKYDPVVRKHVEFKEGKVK
ncbi:MAG: 50S ribosomal protein L33 [Alphaproteobacteria bacterium]|nr:MAG: 50S ribosomal protein L33 [Alphaproteobacteria bacterium]